MSAKDGKPCKKCGGNDWDNHGHCRPCQRENARQRYRKNPDKYKSDVSRWRNENPDKVYNTNRRWRLNNPDRSREYSRRKYAKNPDQHNERAKKWQKENRSKQKEISKRYRQNHLDKDAAKSNRYRARKRGATGDYTVQEWNSLIEHYGGRCLCCGRDDVPLTVDHVIPLVKGGANTIDNLQPLCGSCNSRKQDKSIDYRPNIGFGRWIQRKLME